MSENKSEESGAPESGGQENDQAAPSAGSAGENKSGEKEKPARPWYRRSLWAGTLIVATIGLTIGGILFWRHSRDYESTDDAYIDIQSEDVSSQVAGRVVRVLVNDYEDVTAGQTLLEIDPADFQTRLDQALAAESQARAQVEQTQAQIAVAQQQIEQAQANQLVAEANATNAQRDLKRYTILQNALTGAVSQQQLDAAATQATAMAAQKSAAQKAVGTAAAQLDLARRQVQVAREAVKSAAAQVAQARLNLSYTHVRAYLNGRIADKTVAEGNYAQPGTALMAVVPTNVYVTANFKETQLAHLRRGQSVEIHIDAYPDLKARGRVDSVQPGSGQAFSLLPPQNATGNWVKIVQRVPVKIVFDAMPQNPGQRLAPGMSVEAKVTVR